MSVVVDFTKLTELKELVEEQANDEGLWSLPLVEGTQPIMEAYLQQELRRLHAAVEAVFITEGDFLAEK